MSEEKVLMEKFKEFDIYYNKEGERFIADKPELNIHFEARSLWEIKGCIKESKIEEVNKHALIKSGYFDKSIAKIHLMTINKETERCKYKIVEDTEDSYDVNKIMDDNDTPKMYELTEHNLKVYNEVKKLENDINSIERKQKELVKQLK